MLGLLADISLNQRKLLIQLFRYSEENKANFIEINLMKNIFPKTPYQWVLTFWGIVSCLLFLLEFHWSSTINGLVWLSVIFSTYKSKTNEASSIGKRMSRPGSNSHRLTISAILDPVYISDRPSAVKKNIHLSKLITGLELIRTLDMIYISDRPAVLSILLEHLESPIGPKDSKKIIDLIYTSDRLKSMERIYSANSKFD